VPGIDAALIDDVDLLCLDAGNTVVFLDHARLARACEDAGFAVSTEALVRSEGLAKIAMELRQGLDVSWSMAQVPAARGWGVVVGTMLNLAGLAAGRVSGVLDALWTLHTTHNFWSMVPDGLPEALRKVRAQGVRVAVVSNSEGMLERLLDELGVLRCLDLVVDSGVVGVEKPDPRIFGVALNHFRVPPSRALHLGDTYTSDVIGARAAGLRVALVDPYGHLAGRHTDVSRVPGASEVANEIAVARQGRGRL
jgi:HAD superfamily hydrolase (TIGR01509 family)